MNELATYLTQLRQLGDESGYSETAVGNEVLSFEKLQSHFTKVNDVALKVLGFAKPSEDDRVVSVRRDDLLLDRKVVSTGYLALRDVNVFRASSFTGNLSEFVSFMNKHVGDIKTLEAAMIDFEMTLGRFANHPEELTKVFSGLKKVKLPQGSRILDDFQDYFLGRSGIDNVPVKKLYANMREMEIVGLELVKLTEEFNGTEADEIRERADRMYTTLNYVEEALEDADLEMTREWRHAIGEQLYVMTEWMGIYSLYVTKLVAVTVAHRDTVEKLNGL